MIPLLHKLLFPVEIIDKQCKKDRKKVEEKWNEENS